jgi:hypothetical protein
MSPATDRRYTAPPPDFTRYKLLEIERFLLRFQKGFTHFEVIASFANTPNLLLGYEGM